MVHQRKKPVTERRTGYDKMRPCTFLNCSWRAFFHYAGRKGVATIVVRVQYMRFVKEKTQSDCTTRLVNAVENIVKIYSIASAELAMFTFQKNIC